MRNSRLAQFEAARPFALDDFQRAACQELETGRGVLVAAPTGAGKTVVGEFAIALALNEDRRVFYTTPIKALSNQKYHDFVALHGSGNVGLLTGDTSINPEAPIVVMTTEVLRNMLYTGSTAVHNLGYVVMDEVHYLADRFRGPVWEEVILHLPTSVQLVSLSATVSNAEEFGQWLVAVRGETAVIVSEHRPVPLWQHVVLGHSRGVRGGLFDLYDQRVDATAPGIIPPLNPHLLQTLKSTSGTRADSPSGYGGKRHRAKQKDSWRDQTSSTRVERRGPPRYAVIDLLDQNALLPAIYFIFSRNGCEAALDQCAKAGLSLTTAAEQSEITKIVEERCAELPESDLTVLGYSRWLESLQRGIATHHAGLLPLFKETVEELFVRGLLKAVFATETLALGINMPARSVVLDKLDKWDGTGHVDLTPGEYTQLTGRAGRRGIDVEGHAIVVEHPGLELTHLAGLASKRLYPLRSSFRPTYNMAVNLVDTMGRDRTREILEMSFAQFQADRSVVELAREIQDQTEALEGYAKAMVCDRGDFPSYAQLRRELSDAERAQSKAAVQARKAATAQLIQSAKAGDILHLPGRKHWEYVAVTGVVALKRNGSRTLHVITTQGRHKKLTVEDLNSQSAIVGYLDLPKNLDTRQTAGRTQAGALLRDYLTKNWVGEWREGEDGAASGKENDGADAKRIAQLRAELEAHPAHECPQREEHARWGERWHRLNRENQGLLRKIENKTGGISQTFSRICRVLQELGYLAYERSSDELVMTEQGSWLRRLYVENDLMFAECVRRGNWAELEPAGLAAMIAALIYEPRQDDVEEVTLPGGSQGKLSVAYEATVETWAEIADLERRHRLDTVREPNLGIALPIHRWAMGRNLERTLHGTDLAAGDFVRWTKQVLDVLGQLSLASPDAALRQTAERATAALLRGVVAYSSIS